MFGESIENVVFPVKTILSVKRSKFAGSNSGKYIGKVMKFGSGGRIRTFDLWVMSPTSYRTAPPRDITKTLTLHHYLHCLSRSYFINIPITFHGFEFSRSDISHEAINQFCRHEIRCDIARNRRQFHHIETANPACA